MNVAHFVFFWLGNLPRFQRLHLPEDTPSKSQFWTPRCRCNIGVSNGSSFAMSGMLAIYHRKILTRINERKWAFDHIRLSTPGELCFCCFLVVHVLGLLCRKSLHHASFITLIGRSSPMVTCNHLWSTIIYNHFLHLFAKCSFYSWYQIKLHALAAHFNGFWGWSSWWCLPDRGIRYRLFGTDSWTSMWQRLFEIDSGPCPRNIQIGNTRVHTSVTTGSAH